MKRSLFSQRLLRSGLAVIITYSMMPTAFASVDRKEGASRGTAITIENFGKVNDHIYRGGQPEGDAYRQLVDLGVKTILDLRADADRGARSAAERAGLKYINLPLEKTKYPQADAAARFIEIVNNKDNWPVFTHCAGGRHRTGAMIAAYRMSMDNWTVDQAYDEMKQYDFYTSWGHGCFKDYVFDYARDLARHRTHPSDAPVVAGHKGSF
jgi:tyrosine-protein phosphatase SIW14